jgi:hypothetical protein
MDDLFAVAEFYGFTNLLKKVGCNVFVKFFPPSYIRK